jgi:type IV pilus assembly protein PilB
MKPTTMTTAPKADWSGGAGNGHDTSIRTRLAHKLISTGALTALQLDLALHEQKRTGSQLGPVLVQLGFVDAQALAQVLADAAETKTANLNLIAIEQAALQLVNFETARRYNAMPISVNDHTLTVAVADPFDVVAIDSLHQLTGLGIEVVTASREDILNCQELYYKNGDTIAESIEKILEEKARETVQPLEDVLRQMGDTEDAAPVIRLVSSIIHRAINGGASDIHFEPEERMMRIRNRLDGILYQEILIPKAMQSAVTTRMKILADLDVAEMRIPQDGRATVLVGGREVNLRVSSLPTSFGENIVARILDPRNQLLNLTALGFAPDVEMEFREAVNKPYGVVLVTGPTGSGKTTTLYTVLQEVSGMDVSTFTLEDPIEYRMPLVRQTQIKEESGLTFSAGLRALLRQDPDIILVGETRDTETAQLMVRAALTGHLVFSTLHTNDAAGAIPRLVDMGVEPYLLPACLNAILAQRLVRTICKRCRREVPNPEQVFAGLKIVPLDGMPASLWEGKGCAECKETGYRGRIGVYELMIVDERFHDSIVKQAGAPEYLRLARERGMRTMFEDGVVKASQGITTIEELLRVTRLAQH